MLWYVQNYVVSLLRDKGGANAVEYALIMALVAVFITWAMTACRCWPAALIHGCTQLVVRRGWPSGGVRRNRCWRRWESLLSLRSEIIQDDRAASMLAGLRAEVLLAA